MIHVLLFMKGRMRPVILITMIFHSVEKCRVIHNSQWWQQNEVQDLGEYGAPKNLRFKGRRTALAVLSDLSPANGSQPKGAHRFRNQVNHWRRLRGAGRRRDSPIPSQDSKGRSPSRAARPSPPGASIRCETQEPPTALARRASLAFRPVAAALPLATPALGEARVPWRGPYGRHGTEIKFYRPPTSERRLNHE